MKRKKVFGLRKVFIMNFEKKTAISAVSVLLGIAALASTIAYFVYRIYSNRAYNEKWKDYDDCGLA